MVCGPLLETRNTSGPLLSYKILCPNTKSIEDQKKEMVFTAIWKDFFPNLTADQKKSSSLQFGTVFGGNLDLLY